MDLSNSVTDERGTAFLAWDLDEATAQPDETEQLKVVRVPFWVAVERAKRGEIWLFFKRGGSFSCRFDGLSG